VLTLGILWRKTTLVGVSSASPKTLHLYKKQPVAVNLGNEDF
jgi:hypothetical protein